MIFNKNNSGTDEVALIATWTANHKFQHIEKALILAKRKVIKIVGKQIYDLALSHYLSDNYQLESPTEEQKNLDKLVFWFQTVLVNFAYSKNLYKDTVIWDNSGINVTWSEQYRPAQQQTLDNLSESFTQDAYEFLDLLIEFLNDNKTQFPDFQTSIEALKLKELFISSAEDFNYYFNINNSVSYFFEILDVIRRVQHSEIKNALGADNYKIMIDFILGVTLPEDSFLKPENCTALLQIVKPTIVDLTIYTKFISDISNLKADVKQIEILRANANFLKQKADSGLAKISEYLKSLQTIEITDTQTDDYFCSDNSFVM